MSSLFDQCFFDNQGKNGFEYFDKSHDLASCVLRHANFLFRQAQSSVLLQENCVLHHASFVFRQANSCVLHHADFVFRQANSWVIRQKNCVLCQLAVSLGVKSCF